jgi:hypothetical protein
MAGLLSMGQTGSAVNNSYVESSIAEEDSINDNPLEMIEIPPNVQNDLESESDAMWSDVEIEINNA